MVIILISPRDLAYISDQQGNCMMVKKEMQNENTIDDPYNRFNTKY